MSNEHRKEPSLSKKECQFWLVLIPDLVTYKVLLCKHAPFGINIRIVDLNKKKTVQSSLIPMVIWPISNMMHLSQLMKQYWYIIINWTSLVQISSVFIQVKHNFAGKSSTFSKCGLRTLGGSRDPLRMGSRGLSSFLQMHNSTDGM